MQLVNQELAEIALDRISGVEFERFFRTFYPALADIEFVPLGGVHDGGADAYHGEDLLERKGARPGTFYQASTQEDYRGKIRHTVRRLREFNREPKLLHYVTSRVISAIDKVEEQLAEELEVAIKIRDRNWIVGHINRHPGTVASYKQYLHPQLSFLSELGATSTITQSANLPARTLCVFLGQEVDRRRGNTGLLEAVTDSLILWTLEGTDPDKKLLLSRSAIRDKIEYTLPSSKQFVRDAFDHRLEVMASKGNPTGREVRWYKQEDKFCLPYETRILLTQENIEDEALKIRILALYEDRAASILNSNDTVTPSEIARLTHRALELTFEQQGLELVQFLTSESGENRYFVISDQVDLAIQECGMTGTSAVVGKEAALGVLKQGFYRSSELERQYYGKLSRTYALMLTLRNEPRIVEYFRGMSSNFVLFVGTDILVRALSERYLPDEDQMTVNMLRILAEAGSTLILTHMTVEEVHAHIKATDLEFRNWYHDIEIKIDREVARHASKILIRAYLHARLDPLTERSPSSWQRFIGQICSHTDLDRDSVSRDQIRLYLIEKFQMEYMDDIDVAELIDPQEAAELAAQLVPIKSDEVLAHNDARQILTVYAKRRDLREAHKPNPYGYRTWWLTHEMKVRGRTRELVQKKGTHYIIRPEFILNFVALSPSTEAVRASFGNIFPTLLGVRLSNRMREEVFHDVVSRVRTISEMDDARANAEMSQLSTQLKGDNYKRYEVEFDSRGSEETE